MYRYLPVISAWIMFIYYYRSPPNLCVSKLVQKLKGVSSRKLLQSDKKLQKEYWGRHLWARGYFAVSTGNVTDDIIAEYIKNQDEVERRKKSDNFQVGF